MSVATSMRIDPAIAAEVRKRHDESIRRLQEWIAKPTVAAQGIGIDEGVEHMMALARDAGFQKVRRVETKGVPSVFATLDSGAERTAGVYFMYDVKHADPSEWSSPPHEGRIVDRPGVGKVLMGRGAVNQKGPEAAFLAALHAVRGAGKRLPVNIVLIAEGEEEIGSTNFRDAIADAEVKAALERCVGIFMPSASQDPDGNVTVSLGAKGVIELELIASGKRWGRGPTKDVHSSNRARLDSPALHLVHALATLVTADGDSAIDGIADRARPASEAERAMLDVAAGRISEATTKKLLGATRWAHDLPWRETLERFLFSTTVNIQGLVCGYMGPGGKTMLPHRAVAKLDLRLVPDMTYDDALAKLRAHLAKRGFADIEVHPSGGYDPTSTALDAPIIQAELALYRRSGIDPLVMPRSAGSYPGYVFTGDPLRLPAAHFGLGHGTGAHAPDEYFVVEPANPKVADWDGAIASYVAFLWELAE